MLTHWPTIGKPSFEMIRSSPTAAQSSTTPYFRQLQVRKCNQVCTHPPSLACLGGACRLKGAMQLKNSHHKQKSTSQLNTGTHTIRKNNFSTLILSSCTTATNMVKQETVIGEAERAMVSTYNVTVNSSACDLPILAVSAHSRCVCGGGAVLPFVLLCIFRPCKEGLYVAILSSDKGATARGVNLASMAL